MANQGHLPTDVSDASAFRENGDGDRGKALDKSASDGSSNMAILRSKLGSMIPRDVATLAPSINLSSLNDDIILQPYKYLTSLPSKGFQEQAIDSLNTWLCVPAESATKIKNIVRYLHGTFVMVDDIENNSTLSCGKPSAHSIYGNAQTTNAALFQSIKATSLTLELKNSSCLQIFNEEVHHLYVGRSYDLYWTHNVLCPPMSDYLKMVDMKTGSLFQMLTRLMIAESPINGGLPDANLYQLSHLIGRYFHVRHDYRKLISATYAKEVSENHHDTNYSLTLVHCIQTLELEPKFATEMMQLRSFLIKRRTEGRLS